MFLCIPVIQNNCSALYRPVLTRIDHVYESKYTHSQSALEEMLSTPPAHCSPVSKMPRRGCQQWGQVELENFKMNMLPFGITSADTSYFFLTFTPYFWLLIFSFSMFPHDILTLTATRVLFCLEYSLLKHSRVLCHFSLCFKKASLNALLGRNIAWMSHGKEEHEAWREQEVKLVKERAENYFLMLAECRRKHHISLLSLDTTSCSSPCRWTR